MKKSLARVSAVGIALSMTAATLMPAAAQDWSGPKSTVLSSNVLQVKDRKPHHQARFERRGKYAYYNGHRGYRERHAGYRYYNGYWFPPAAFLAAIIGGAIGAATH